VTPLSADREAVFLSLVAEHRTILYKVARAYGRTQEDRADLVAEMTAALWTSFGRFDDRYRFSTWMYRIALNIAISFYRVERRRLAHASEIDPVTLEIAAVSAGTDGQVRGLHDFIDTLADLDKALMLLYLDGYAYRDIAAMIGISETNVGTKLNRIRHRARETIGSCRCVGDKNGI
jgi:RNA polymerase sigma factor (sigma-70 family)